MRSLDLVAGWPVRAAAVGVLAGERIGPGASLLATLSDAVLGTVGAHAQGSLRD